MRRRKIEGKGREREKAGDSGDELRIGGSLGRIVGKGGRGDVSDVAEEKTVHVGGGG